MTLKRALTSDRLRRDIDSRLGGDEVDFPGPAGGQLGSDDEVGRAPSREDERGSASLEVPGLEGEVESWRLWTRTSPLSLLIALASVFLVVLAVVWIGWTR